MSSKFLSSELTRSLTLFTLAAIAGGAGIAHAEESAQSNTAAADEESTDSLDTLDQVVVIGTRRRDRTVTESSAPIDVLTGNDVAAQPAGSMLDALSNMVPSFSVGQNAISDASSLVRSPSLRGLPGDEMLVMLNGKRYNRSALVQVFQGGETELSFGSQAPDVGALPSNAVKSLEILRDGASAQYGSDAIAGVLNYQFKDAPNGLEVTGRYGKYFPGSPWKSDGADRLLGVSFGLPLSSEGFVHVSAEYNKYDQTVRNPTRPSALALAKVRPDLAPGLPHYPGPVQEWGTPPSEGFKSLVNGGVHLSDGSQLYFLVNYAHVNTNESFNYRLPFPVTDPDTGDQFGNNPVFNDVYTDACSSHPNYTGCAQGGFISNSTKFNFQSVYPSGYTPRFYGTTEEVFTTLGYKGTTKFGMDYDFSGTWAQNSLAMWLKSSLNSSLGPLSPTEFYLGKFVQQESTFALDVSKAFAVPALPTPITVAGGLEWHHEGYQQLLGDPDSYAAGPYTYQPLYTCTGTVCAPTVDGNGDQVVSSRGTGSNGFGGIGSAVDATQHNTAAYIDVELDPVKSLTLGAAARYEKYSTFGSTGLGKLQVRFAPVSWLALRGTGSTGFHAPSPGQNNVETLSTTFVPGTTTQVAIGTYRVTSPIAQYYGATTLTPEKSTNLSAGIVLTPAPRMQLTIDYYDIKVKNRIGISQAYAVTQQDINNLPVLANVGIGGTVQYFTNGFDTDTKGYDIVFSYPFEIGPATLATTLAYNYNKTTVPSYDPAVINQTRIIDIEHYAPNNRVNLTLDLKVGNFVASLHENYYGTWRDEFDYPDQLFGAKYTTDLDLQYTFADKVTAAIGAKNLFNAYPDRIRDGRYAQTGGLGDGEYYPRSGGPFGFNGRFMYVRFGLKF